MQMQEEKCRKAWIG